MKMASKRINKRDKDLHIKLLHQFGEQGLYEKICGVGILSAATNTNADIELLNLAEAFFTLFRQTGNDDYAAISRALRRSAHRIMRELMKQKEGKMPDSRFLIRVA